MLPAKARAEDRTDHRLDHHQVHELAVDELLEGHREKRSHRFPVEPEGVGAERELQAVEGGPVERHRHRIEEEQPVDREQVDERRQKRQQDLEEDEIREKARRKHLRRQVRKRTYRE